MRGKSENTSFRMEMWLIRFTSFYPKAENRAKEREKGVNHAPDFLRGGARKKKKWEMRVWVQMTQRVRRKNKMRT